MSYHHPQAVGGLLSFITDPIVDIVTGGTDGGASPDTCLQQQSRTTAALDAQTNGLAAAWRPTGFYRLEDLARMRDEVFKLLVAASAAVDKAIAAGAAADHRAVLRGAQARVQKKMAESLPFTNAVAAARAQGVRVLDAPGFKRWVIDAMNQSSNATGAAAYMACIKPVMVKVVQALVAMWGVLVTIGKGMVRATIALGEQILKIPDRLADLWTYTKWGSLAVLAYYALKPKKRA